MFTCSQLILLVHVGNNIIIYHTLVLWDTNIYSILKMYSIFADTSPCKIIGHSIQPIPEKLIAIVFAKITLRLLRVFAIFSTVFFFARCKLCSQGNKGKTHLKNDPSRPIGMLWFLPARKLSMKY